MHEYPRNSVFDSVSESRLNALAGFGFTQRQREFLVTVMVHAGCFLERQYCAFTGTVRGQNSREFVSRLVARGFARATVPGPVRRGRLYHVHHKPLYEAIGLGDDRNRRLHSIGRMVERTMILDAVLGDGRCWWLSPAEDKRTFFDARETGLRDEEYPHISFSAGRGKIIRCFPDKLPIGIDKEDSSRFVFLYLVTRRIPIEFRQFLIRHHTLFLNLHTWTVRLLVPRRFRKAVALYKAALREELWTPLDPSVSKALETYFRERRERGGHLAEPGDRFIAREFRRQGMAKIAALYRVWRREGDVVLWRSSSTSLRDDRMHGCSVCEVQDLNARYLQLTTAIDREAWAKKGATRCRQLCDGRRLVDHSKRVDARIAQAYVDVITSVPHGTPSVRRHGQRSAHSAGAPGHGIERTPKHRRLMHDDRERFVGAPIELRTSVPLTARHPQDHALRRERVHQGVTLPWLD